MYLGPSILDTGANEVLLGQNEEVLALTYYVHLNISAMHMNVYITDICTDFCEV